MGYNMPSPSRFFVRYRRWCFFAAAGLALGCWGPSRQLSFDRSIEQMFAKDDPLLPAYQRLKDRFGGNEVVLLVYRDSGLFAEDGNGLQRLSEITARCQGVRGVRAVLSLSEVDRVLRETSPQGLLGRSNGRSPLLAAPPSLGATFRELFEGITHSRDGRTVAVACLLDPSQFTADYPRRRLVSELRGIARSVPEGALVGEPVMVEDGFDLVEQDGTRLARGTGLLLALTMLVLFRNIRWMLIPLAVVAWSSLATRAVLYWSGIELTMVSSMLTAIVTVIAVATSVHFLLRFREFRSGGLSPVPAMTRTVELLMAPVTWACLTDAIGFASLKWARVGPVHDFGIMMALGATMVLIGSLLIIPGLALLGGRGVDPQRAYGEGHLGTTLSRLLDFVERRPRSWVAVTLAVAVVAGLGTLQLEVETDFTRNFRRSSELVQGYRRVERELGGAGVWDAMIPAPAALDRDYVERVAEWERDLRELQVEVAGTGERVGLTKALSFADLLAASESSSVLRLVPMQLRAEQIARRMADVVPTLWWRRPGRPAGSLRVLLRSRESLPATAKLELIQAVEQKTQSAFRDLESAETPAEVTGFYVLLANLIQSLLRDQWLCFLIATSGIVTMMLVAFRSLRLALVAVVPNLLPIFLLLGVMGHCQVRLNMGAAMIAAVSIGLSVDSSIHYTICYLRARRRGMVRADALEQAQQTVGRALVFATLGLVLGFSSLCTSQFIPTVYFGGLVSLAMLGGLAGNLFVLPLLIQLSRA